ncbi:bifunctional hydroxymethylpyrimidine kinase/phosphomethylpyrimidine kinase [uncultured Anaerococcus sp.]|uniref:bifunctional hydroxymethylpyrimidine kinase/phosphomethylpyrimidine kinase n=1 Tax=uncultured Anaerococcus sp. TaxID=293428 RepID=UPI002804B390|nr:bifunctional hydroxymethylpyrimidine kinase/phosphomethylpyrimidine kinase [uncultured Anaerococcus sp.]
MKTCLTIAGSDSSGGAGIQADLKTMTVNGVYAMSVITALTAQNTQGVTGILDVSPEFITEQMDAVFTDIYPEAIKIGMVSSPEIVEAIAASLEKYQAKNIVLDPVMVATSGAKLLKEEAMDSLINRLIPLADVITPNIPEGEILAGMEITNEDQMIKAAEKIGKKYDCAVLLKGGHRVNDANDLLYRDGEFKWFRSERIDNPNTHGTGCTLSSAIGANLAKGYDIDQAIEMAKDYLTGALRAGLDLGKGSGPLMHNYKII